VIQGSCHCGAIHWRFEPAPLGATACNCTICRRYGALWIYDFENEGAYVTGATMIYIPGKSVEFHFCPTCGCVTHWRSQQPHEGRRRLAVNARMAEPDAVAHIPIDHFDGLHTFDDLPRDGRRVADYWF
jgi:hypothetical protein